MKITMLVSVSRGDFNARIGQTVDVETELAQDLIANQMAIVAGAIADEPNTAAPEPVPPPTAGLIDLVDGVDDTEATLAGKALARRKKGA